MFHPTREESDPMARRTTVGRGWRTPGKLFMLHKLLGQEIGAASRLKWKPPKRHVLIDLTAGDAAVDNFFEDCSPGLMIYHGLNSALPVLIVLYEVNRNTYDTLVSNVTAQLGDSIEIGNAEGIFWARDNVVVQAVLGSGADAVIDYIQPTDAVFIANDPNTMHDFAMRFGMIEEIRARGVMWCRTFHTLGCNVGGMHRLSYEERQQWFQQLDDIKASLPRWHDLVLAAIDNDSARWAYAITTSRKWRDETEKVIIKALNKIERNAVIAWWRTEPDKFAALERKLFMTNAERLGL